MRPNFSEFSYGFAFTYGIVNDLPGITTAPELPSLTDEAQKGYDVKLAFPGLPLFFQYKVADILTDSRAKYWGYYKKAYLRFNITARKRSRQHYLLKKLAESSEPDVYYAAPLFSTEAEFNDAFLANQVARRSIWMPLDAMPYLTDDEPHHVTYTSTADPSWHTEEGNLRGEVLRGEFSAEQIYASIQSRFLRDDIRLIDTFYVRELRIKLYDILGQNRAENRLDFSAPVDNNSDMVRDIRYMLITYFGADLTLLRGI